MEVKKVLVTGASGYIGSRLVRCLRQNNVEVVGITRKENKKESNSVQCDFLKTQLDDSCFDGVDAVFHLAAATHDISNQLGREHYFALNVDVTLSLAKQSARLNVKKFVYISSVKALGSGSEELASSAPSGLYGESKQAAEKELARLAGQREMAVEIVRPSLVYGPNAPGNIGKMKSAIAQGWFPPLPDFGNARSMIHVDDLVRLLLLLLNSQNNGYRAITVSDKKRYSSADLYENLRISLGLSIPRYRMPKIIFRAARKLHPRVEHSLDKLIESQYYPCVGLEEIGFSSIFTLKDIDKSLYEDGQELTSRRIDGKS